MDASGGKRAGGRWRLTVALGDEVSPELRDQLVERAIEAANGPAGGSIRRSRHAATFNIQPQAQTERLDAFVKVIDAPRGFERIKRLLRGNAGVRVARITRELAGAGLEAPAVLLYGADRASGREIIVTHRAGGDGPLRTLGLLAGSIAHKRAILRALGREVARLHRAGFVHGDLTPFNVLFVCGEPPGFTFLDHERTRRNLMFALKRRQLRNLVQLGRFDLPGITRADRMRFYRAYEFALTGRNRRRSVRRAAAMLNRRLARDRPALARRG
jgi:hypothetical protein